MIFSRVLGLTTIALANASAISIPSLSTIELANTTFSTSNISLGRPIVIPSADLSGDEIDDRLKPIYQIYPGVALNQRSLFMTVLKVMILLSAHDYIYPYPGGIFSFKDYKNIKLEIGSEHASMQYRFAILGLYRTMRMCVEKGHSNALVAELF